MPQPSAAVLLEALRDPGESYESLAARLPISLSTVNRWKKRSPRDWDTILGLLSLAGWLDTDAIRRARAQAEAEAAAQMEALARRQVEHGSFPQDRRRSA